ncbi:hypothetical protein BSI_05760 [Bacillus inaquosorum KCTC 13429]|uniref:Uncharacterized protein n=1 Tax=Bacillus inaquosorum KCTC 13429 TaxID=1236548 RepID=A0A9W5PEY2_9BACI|nr:hypothetical protein BSI_05760 [Bacillus inaquosorum KCTC 13429]
MLFRPNWHIHLYPSSVFSSYFSCIFFISNKKMTASGAVFQIVDKILKRFLF